MPLNNLLGFEVFPSFSPSISSNQKHQCRRPNPVTTFFIFLPSGINTFEPSPPAPRARTPQTQIA